MKKARDSTTARREKTEISNISLSVTHLGINFLLHISIARAAGLSWGNVGWVNCQDHWH